MSDKAKTTKNILMGILNHRETNFVITSLIGLSTIYIFFISIFDGNLFHPLRNETTPFKSTFEKTFNNNVTSAPAAAGEESLQTHQQLSNDSLNHSSNSESPINGTNNSSTAKNDTSIIRGEAISSTERNLSSKEEERTSQFYIASFFSFFILWVLALACGYLINCFGLPHLLGNMLVGVAFANLSILDGLLSVIPAWDLFLRRMAFILILVRCAFGLNYDALRKSFVICSTLGLLSTTVEACLICFAAHFLFGVPLGAAILFGYVLGSTSPAVTVPTMIRLQNEERGTNKGIPSIVLAAAAIDNIYSITAFSAVSSVVFARADSLSYTIVRIPVELLVAAILGIFAGIVLRSFPQKDASFVHFIRSSLAFFVSMAFYFGTRAIQADVAGPVAVILMTVVIAMRWKTDNPRQTLVEERCFRVIWNLFFQPFLFVLIGLLLNFSIFTWKLLAQGISLLVIGVVGRILIVFIISLFTKLNFKERTFISITFMPKATVQAALAPVLYQLCLAQFPRGSDECTNLILQTCILSIILTAPIGQLLIFLLGKTMLKKRILLYSLPPPPPTMGGPPAAYKGKMPILGAEGTESKSVQIGKPETMEGISVSADNRHKLRLELRDNLPRKIGQEKAPTTVSIVHTPTPLSNHSHTNSNKVGTATPSFGKSLPVPAENESYDDFKARMAIDPGKNAADNSIMSPPTFVDVKF